MRRNDGDWFPFSSDFPMHRKTLHLRELIGDTADAYPTRLMCWLRDQENLDGSFRSIAEVEFAARWAGKPGALVAALRAAGFLDGLTYHGWAGKGGEFLRRFLAERARLSRRYRGNAAGKPRDSRATAAALPELPSPSPSPSTEGPKGPKVSLRSEDAAFEAFWATWPAHKRKVDRKGCASAWRAVEPASYHRVMASLEAWKRSWDWAKDQGEYIPAPMVWLHQRRWEGADPSPNGPAGLAPPAPEPAKGPSIDQVKAEHEKAMAEDRRPGASARAAAMAEKLKKAGIPLTPTNATT